MRYLIGVHLTELRTPLLLLLLLLLLLVIVVVVVLLLVVVVVVVACALDEGKKRDEPTNEQGVSRSRI